MREAVTSGIVWLAIVLAGCSPPNAARRLIVPGNADAAPPADGQPNDIAAADPISPDAGPGAPEPTGAAIDAQQEGDGGGPGPDGESRAGFDAVSDSEPAVPPDVTAVDAATVDASAAFDQAVPPPPPPDPPRPPDVAPPAPEPVPPTTDCLSSFGADLIADFERNRPVTVVVAGRGGTPWTVLNAETNTGEIVVTSIVERCGSQLALRFDGSTFATRVPLVRATFVNADPADSGFYDASAYRGVRLSLRSAAPVAIQIKVPDRNTDPAGGFCATCEDHFGARVTATAEWQTFTVFFSDLRQEGTGDQFSALDLTGLFALQIHAPQVDGAFDLWIDDVTFVP